ncbi:starch phosphorylase [Monocercomonoides exilis]|uniref:starch phosphorylase n=1 Tax=Monocercomonoides exilis TaxID=2049356 RepID=UPI00355A1794|nr:starch phosphorylase [Monocercomonoides exilis]|eukprot:MONOS_11054.1-p1 / transcript=MONOS_11054.1 / gene=MONOS_11054 / organism=Monocercomonoides_exilis_PA203 / gene_product=starch phosphorylase / transcript_product=starch phosphorylase / location=Mono_scaffold00533:9699-12886(-) / protein_length=993 / sequence_SO=supercontig / SO=protein_coding / is_pseudo=false
MTTPYSYADSIAQRQRQRVPEEDEKFRATDTSESFSPSQGFLTRISSGTRLLPRVNTIANRDNPEEKQKLNLLFSMRRQFLQNDTKSILQSICDHVEFRCARTKWSFDLGVAYHATALSVRDRLIELWNDTNRHFHEKNPKRLYYLSIEYLIGRLLRSNLLSLTVMNEYTSVLSQIGLKMEEVAEQEIDMGLGNGGLGRLAACYLDSMASLRLPAWGYGLRYQYGMFKQKISPDGDQIELPDYWLENGCPWEIQRNDVKYKVRFFGHVEEYKEKRVEARKRMERRRKTASSASASSSSSFALSPSSFSSEMMSAESAPLPRAQFGASPSSVPSSASNDEDDEFEWVEVTENYEIESGPIRKRWVGGEEVIARAYDVPIAGFRTLNTINLRLWESVPSHEFDLSSFNRGSYDDAVRAKQQAETITQVLYPNDAFTAGKELRLRQQYFFVCSSLHDIIRRFEKQGKPYSDLPEAVMMQCNDTHPVLAIPELMRILMDEKMLEFDEAWKITQGCFGYTNHTVLPEALEKWPVDLLGRMLPRHLEIIYLINHVFLESIKGKYDAYMGELSIVEEYPVKCIRMANLAIVTSSKVNGVAELHSQLLKTTIFRHFYEVFPDKFLNVTNGVTQRRWLLEANPPLAKLYDSKVGSRWTVAYKVLRRIESQGMINKPFIDQFWNVKRMAKEKLVEVIERECGQGNPAAAGVLMRHGAELDNVIFDVHVKRLHEYKRQSLNILRCIYEYLELKKLSRSELLKRPPKVVIFGGKAAPGYFMAKKTIKLICAVGNVVNKDESIMDALKIVFIPNYCVSLAQIIIPAADISEQISTAGYEASGTSCMKFCMNGALLVGTWDGANIEIVEEIGANQAYIFGLKAEEIEGARARRHSPSYTLPPSLTAALDAIDGGKFGNPADFAQFTDNIRNSDHYLVSMDFEDYIKTHKKIEEDWAKKDEWGRRAILNSIRMDKFSSDRSIIDYSEKIWNIKPCMVPQPIVEAQGR